MKAMVFHVHMIASPAPRARRTGRNNQSLPRNARRGTRAAIGLAILFCGGQKVTPDARGRRKPIHAFGGHARSTSLIGDGSLQKLALKIVGIGDAIISRDLELCALRFATAAIELAEIVELPNWIDAPGFSQNWLGPEV
jgi:hypothetical protein